MAGDEELSSLERVRQRLYSPTGKVGFEQPHLAEQRVQPATGWKKTPETPLGPEGPHLSGPARFFIFALIFFVIVATGAGLYLVYGGRAVSTNNVIVTVQGPTTIASGDIVPLSVTIQNKNPVALHGATLSIDYPEGTKDPVDSTKPLTNITLPLGDIPPGGKTIQTLRGSIFGSEGQAVTLPIKIEYTTDGSNSTFVKNTKYDLTITTSPLALTVNALSQVSSGQTITVDVLVRSNATTPLENVAVSANLPFGFVLSSATPTPSASSLFVLGTLAPGEEKHITVTGVVSGENNDERIFTFNAGTVSASNSQTLATSFTTKEADIRITKPFLATTLAVNHDTGDNPVITTGTKQQALISWTNTLTTPIKNAQITVSLSGNALDPASVTVANGYYRSSDTTALFTPDTTTGLASLEPGDSGQGSITFTTKKPAEISLLRQPTITFTISVSGQRIGEGNVPENITSSVTRTARVGTGLNVSTKIVHSIGPFKNTGPWPPVANQETTYTVQYALTNTVNAVAGAKVVTTLPSYVRFTGLVNPSDNSITYNESSRTVTWTVGDVPAGTGSPLLASFQIALTPSTSQVQTSPVLLYAQQVTGTDRFTQGQISGSLQQLTTQLTGDPAYVINDGEVH